MGCLGRGEEKRRGGTHSRGVEGAGWRKEPAEAFLLHLPSWQVGYSRKAQELGGVLSLLLFNHMPLGKLLFLSDPICAFINAKTRMVVGF